MMEVKSAEKKAKSRAFLDDRSIEQESEGRKGGKSERSEREEKGSVKKVGRSNIGIRGLLFLVRGEFIKKK